MAPPGGRSAALRGSRTPAHSPGAAENALAADASVTPPVQRSRRRSIGYAVGASVTPLVHRSHSWCVGRPAGASVAELVHRSRRGRIGHAARAAGRVHGIRHRLRQRWLCRGGIGGAITIPEVDSLPIGSIAEPAGASARHVIGLPSPRPASRPVARKGRGPMGTSAGETELVFPAARRHRAPVRAIIRAGGRCRQPIRPSRKEKGPGPFFLACPRC